MNLIDRYIGTAVLKAALLVALVFIGLNTIFALVDELKENEVGYGVQQVLTYVALSSPRRIYELMPYVAFMGGLLGLGSLAGHSELVVMRCAGVSVARLAGAVAAPVVLLIGLSVVIGEYIGPLGEEVGKAYKARAKQDSDSKIFLRGGHWYREGGLYMNFAAVDKAGNLLGIRQFQFDRQHRMSWSRIASRAEFVPANQHHSQGWLLYAVAQTSFSKESTRVENFKRLMWPSEANPRLLSAKVLLEPKKLSISDLLFQIAYMNREELNADTYRLALWAKVLQPLSIIGLSLVAMGFILGPLGEVGIGLRLSVGMLTAFAFKYLQELFAPISLLYSMPIWLGVLIPILFSFGVGWWLLRRA